MNNIQPLWSMYQGPTEFWHSEGWHTFSMPVYESTQRQLSQNELATALRDSRSRTWALVDDLTDTQWTPPFQRGVNPVAWELGHLAWFAEFWILRGPHTRGVDGMANAALPPRFAGPDTLFDSARLAHARRWMEAMPTRAELETILSHQLDACIAAIPDGDQDEALYFHRLALFHEDMHAEAFAWLRAALGYPAPNGCQVSDLAGWSSTPLHIAGKPLHLGCDINAAGFAFDNELPGCQVTLQDFEIDSAPICFAEFARFVDAGGYDNPLYWPGQAGAWRVQSALSHPQRWRRNTGGSWHMRWFDQWVRLPMNSPVIHVNAYEAEAWCLWAGRRLPSAAQWELAARSQPAFIWGRSVWEWTCDAFAPYPGFHPGPYKEYSEPWFGDHRELRGGAIATHARMHNPRYRNFFQSHRSDIFAGFRTVTV